MKKSTTFSLITASLFVMMTACSTQPNTIQLFNGSDLEGWSGYLDDSTLNTADEFIVTDGVIRLSGKLGYIHTNNTYSNYKLTAEWRWPEKATNSGIFIHTQPEYKALPENFECQLMATNAGDIYNSGGASCAEFRADSTRQVVKKAHPSNEKPVGEWNQAEIICKGDTVTTFINGVQQTQVTGVSKSEGFIGLQSEGEAVEFRNIVLTPLK